MKYLQALAEKNLRIEDLSKMIQLKIELIGKAKSKEKADKLDTEAERLIKKFNLETYKKKLERIKEVNKKRLEKNQIDESVVQNESFSADSDVQNEIEVEVEQDEQDEQEKLFEKLKELKEKTEINIDSEFEEKKEPEPELVEAEEIEDFKKEKTSYRPKSQNLGLIIMGASTFFFIWGLMMYANSKRQNG